MMLHHDYRDTPNVGRLHGSGRVEECGLCRCGAHNAEDDPDKCEDCMETIRFSALAGTDKELVAMVRNWDDA